jgi:hypothetical protein
MSETDGVLARYDKLATALTETGRSIPESLASERDLSSKLGAAEIAGDGADVLRAQLTTVTEDRVSAARRRQSACEGLLQMDGELAKARERMSRVQSEIAAGTIQEFSRRWTEACRALVMLRAEATVLAKVLGVTVPVPPPYSAHMNLIHGTPELRPVEPADSIQPASLPPALATLNDIIGRLDVALGACRGVRQSHELTQRYFAMNRGSGMGEMAATFVVTKPFVYLGSEFEAGVLVNRDVLPVGALHRFWLGKCVRPLDQPGSEAAA